MDGKRPCEPVRGSVSVKPEHGRLIAVSNRVGPIRDAARAGGLAVALVDTMRRAGGIWMGWSGKVVENPSDELTRETHGKLTLATLDLSESEHDQYYNGFSNGVLWPLFHYRLDLTRYRRVSYAGYRAVNARFASRLACVLRDDDVIWIHDFHLLPLAEELRRLGCRQPIGFFLHIPFPAPEVLATLPPHAELVRSLFAYDLVGFQTEGDRRCFVNYVLNEAAGNVAGDGRVSAFGRTVTAEVFPIGIDGESFRRTCTSKEAHSHADRMLSALDKRKAIVGVDRLDYTKGLPERFRAFERFLQDNPQDRGKVSYVQVAPPSRMDVRSYVDIREELQRISGRINGAYAEFDWTPLRYINRPYSRRALAGIYRISVVGLVTPLRDGMNLVAWEYVAAQPEDDPGVLILSRFAGAAQNADGALIVNPYDVQGVADAIKQALSMSQEERIERWTTLYGQVSRNDVRAWSRGFLKRLHEVRSTSGVV